MWANLVPRTVGEFNVVKGKAQAGGKLDQYGWPLVARTEIKRLSWYSLAAEMPFEGKKSFLPQNAMIDAVVGLFILGIVWLAAEWWVRRAR